MSPLSEPARSRPARRISLTPLVDIVFILVVFFMLASSFESRSTIEVVLGGSGSPSGDVQPTRLDVAAGGAFRFDGHALSADALPAALRAYATNASPVRPVVVALGEGAIHQDLVRALEALAAAKLDNVSVLPPAEAVR